MVKIAPSILSADFSRLGEEIKKVEKHSDMLHVDVMDGHFVPNITFGPPVVASIRKVTKLFLDVHLMIQEPDKYVEKFAKAGADMMSVHAEASGDLRQTIKKIKECGVKPAAVLNPETPVAEIEGVLGEVDMILLMTVNPGFGGQNFIESVLPKIRELREKIDGSGLKVELEVDGGINAETARLAVSAGASVLVAGSYIYSSRNPAEAIRKLRV